MKKILLLLISFGLFTFFTSGKTEAQVTFQNPVFNVEINIEKDSTFTVKEKILYRAFGEFHGLRRDITLENPGLREFCLRNPNTTCGGFDRLIPIAVYDYNGEKLNVSQYKTYEYTDEDTNNRYFRFEREYYPNGRNVNGEEFGWIVEYKILGGIEWLNDIPYFYWNTLPENRSGQTIESQIIINFPEDMVVNPQNLILYDSYLNQNVDFNLNRVTISLRNIGAIGNFTVAYKFEKDDLLKPATLNYSIKAPRFTNHLYLDGIEIASESKGKLDFIPSGKHTLKISHTGYKDYIEEIDFQAGEVISREISLEPEIWMQFLLILNTLGFVFGLFLIPAAVVYVIYHYFKKGRDINMPKTIIPLFSPLKDIHPYLLGTIKDEKVDKSDIVGSIIDLAYRGYIKIKELEKGKDYQLTRLEGKKDDPGLNEVEKYLMDSLFGKVAEIKTSNLSSTFPYKYRKLVNMIYDELVERKYFSRSPEKTRGMYAASGIFLMSLAIMFTCGFGIFGTAILGYLVICSPAIALFFLGFGFLIAAKFMPAKTEEGSKVFAEILGFKMYLHTAERYRLQKLGPDEFEKYLSYAVVFGIEKEWAKKFEGIYDRHPDWYEGSSTDVWSAVWVSSLVRSFADSTVTNMIPVSSSGSSSGGGWSSGGGSFGGFSGGGGGGGSSGGW